MAASRDDALRSIRPDLSVDTSECQPVEAFQHDVLRPILKFLNPLILDLVADTLQRYGTGFARMDGAEQQRRLENLLGQDSRLKRTLLGMVLGHFTEDEMKLYLQHPGEIRRRTVELVTERVRSQVDALLDRFDST